jgi:hypothetical protein
MVYWNPRSVHNKEEVLKKFLKDSGAVYYAGLSESQTYKSSELSDGTWRWDAGAEKQPPASGGRPSRGMGAFIKSTAEHVRPV